MWSSTRCANRAAILHDASIYFQTLRKALLQAREQVLIVGWDIHSETELVGASRIVDDGFPVRLGDFLKALVECRPSLRINILIWDYATLYAVEREWNSAEKFSIEGNDQLRFHFDNGLPFGSAQHQKIVVIDGSLAFTGGLDLTIRRWDTREHLKNNDVRVDPDGKGYPPFHDVQCVIDGAAAKKLHDLALGRWATAGIDLGPSPSCCSPVWPKDLKADVECIELGIARTEPQQDPTKNVYEVARLFEAAINTANDLIYIENQFISSQSIAIAIAGRMRKVPALRVLIITPMSHASWFESRAMEVGRDEFLRAFVDAGVADRLNVVYPVTDGQPIMVHSKVMIVDDRLVRIGSANLNNRSMGADSECDLVFDCKTDSHLLFARELRRELLAHFCGVGKEDVPVSSSDLFEFLRERRNTAHPKSLQPVVFGTEHNNQVSAFVQPIADPQEPLYLEAAAERMPTRRIFLVMFAALSTLVLLTLAWRYTALSQFANASALSGLLESSKGSFSVPLVSLLAFIIGGMIFFPVIILIAATSAALGPLTGGLTAITGVLLSAFLSFIIGRFAGHKKLQSVLGSRSRRLQQIFVKRGIFSVALIRLVPVAPFTLINLLAGASRLSVGEFLLGTLLGMAPGILLMAVLGSQIADFVVSASWSDVLPIAVTSIVWLALCFAAQFVVTWFAGRRHG